MKNRFMLAPLTNSQSHEDGVMSEEEFHWLTMRAKGGFWTNHDLCFSYTGHRQRFSGQIGCIFR